MELNLDYKRLQEVEEVMMLGDQLLPTTQLAKSSSQLMLNKCFSSIKTVSTLYVLFSEVPCQDTNRNSNPEAFKRNDTG
jgi:hypothetical protein